MSPQRLCALLSAVLLTVGALTAGCAHEDRAAVAAAKCSLPVDEKVGLADTGTTTEKKDVEVTDLGEGRYRVTGTTLAHSDRGVRGAAFVCEVAPDNGDKLRGFTVTRLEVGPVRNVG